MTDLEEMRKRYADSLRHCECGAAWEASEYTVLHQCPSCDGYETWQATRDEGVLALCDEVEALRAKVAAAPEVLREWPKTVEEAPGEWFFCIHGDCAPRGTFATRDGYALPVFVNESGGSLWVSGEMKPGEFFVRVP